MLSSVVTSVNTALLGKLTSLPTDSWKEHKRKNTGKRKRRQGGFERSQLRKRLHLQRERVLHRVSDSRASLTMHNQLGLGVCFVVLEIPNWPH